MMGDKRESYFTVLKRLAPYGFTMPNTIHVGGAISVSDALELLGNGKHGAIDCVEGLIYRIERKGEVDFLVKYVRQEKENGIYFPEISGKAYVENKVKIL
jgi:hypothetical protein